MPAFTCIGERLNTHREAFQKIVEERDAKAAKREASRQQRHGATHLDFNTSANKDKELDDLLWLLDTVLPKLALETGIVIDTTSTDVLSRALGRIGKRNGTLVNAVGGDPARTAEFLALAAQHGAGVIAVLSGASGAPRSADERLNLAARLRQDIVKSGIAEENIYFDPQVLPLAYDSAQPKAVLETVRGIRRLWPGAHTLAGLSNVSFNMPRRSLLNRTYLAMLLESGIDGLICDPCDKKLRAALLAARALLGQDEFLATYLSEILPDD
jgi:cobalamin-dependent methionine synthase I